MDNREKKFTKAVGKKFYPDGKVRYYPGNTFLCHLPSNSKQASILSVLQSDLQKQPFADKLAFLPPDSFHMTVLEGLCDEEREPCCWSNLCDLNCSITEVNRIFFKRIPLLPTFQLVRMKWKRYYFLEESAQSYTICLVPADRQSEKNLWQFRQEAQRHLKINLPSSDVYQFHISISYTLQYLKREECYHWSEWAKEIDLKYQSEFGVLELGPVEFCVFHDMFSFYPI